jgi:hypothetical protein
MKVVRIELVTSTLAMDNMKVNNETVIEIAGN